jgi:5-methylcytosine-specific restriction endonuclease McrA
MNKKEYNRLWRKKNRERLRLYNQNYREQNREKVLLMPSKSREKRRLYEKTYREKHKAILPERKSKYRLTTSQNKKRLKDKLISRDGEQCRQCGTKENLTLQHKFPRILGGTYELNNLELLCLKCNIRDYHTLVKKSLIFYFQHHSTSTEHY